MAQTIFEKELEEAAEKGSKKAKLEDAKKMAEKGYTLNDIIEITGLSKEQLEEAGILEK